MNKEETIRRYGEAEYARRLEQTRVWRRAHKEEVQTYNGEYYEDHREEVKAATKKYYEEHLEQVAACAKKYREEHPEEVKARAKKWREDHPEQVIAHNREIHRRGGKYYDKKLKDDQTGLRGERNKIRMKHVRQYKPYKDIIAPDSQIHHEWIPDTSEYTGMALVEAERHMHGIVDVIEILEGKITLLTEEEVKKGKKNE